MKLNVQTMDYLEENIKEDFKDLIKDLDRDMEIGREMGVMFYVWEEDERILGYMGFAHMRDCIWMSYNKIYDKSINRSYYNLFKKIVTESNTPVLTDGTSINTYRKHVIPFRNGTWQFKFKG